ncbi:MAG: lamin tail domain-containing protein, partial [Christensenellales bacterium]
MRNKSVLLLLAVLLTGAIVAYLIFGGNIAGGGNSETGTENYDSSFAGSVLINEAMAANPGVVPAGDGGFYDWVELYNPSDVDVNISGWGLSDESNVAAKWTFGEGTVIPAKGYLLVFCSDLNQSNPSGELHAAFKLKAGSDTVVLSDATGKAVDKLPLPMVTEGHSIGRNPADVSDWLDFSEPTPGFSNDEQGRAAYVASMDASGIGLIIAEFQPANKTTAKTQSGEFSDWVEIYNPTGSEIDMSGFGLSDDREKPLKWTFPKGTKIPAG